MTRKEFIETQTDPSFYSVSYKGSPLNIFILPTVHTVPLEALHSDLLKTIRAIAHSEGSQVFWEVGGNFSDDDGRSFLNDPRIRLNIENCVQRDLKCYSNLFKKYYEHLPTLWAQNQEELAARLHVIYQQGWTKSLDLENQKIISFIAKYNKIAPDFIDNLDPYYIYLVLFKPDLLKKPALSKKPAFIVSNLDTRIVRIFAEHKRSILGLENRNDRDEADSEEVIARLPLCAMDFKTYKTTIENNLKKVPLPEDLVQKYTVYDPALNDLDFNNISQMSFLKGTYQQPTSISTDERNKKWWEKK